MFCGIYSSSQTSVVKLCIAQISVIHSMWYLFSRLCAYEHRALVPVLHDVALPPTVYCASVFSLVRSMP